MRTFNSFEELSEYLGENFEKALEVDLSGFLLDMVYARTKSGYGVDRNGGSLTKFITLSPSTILRKQKLGRPADNNLTDTGEMLDSFTCKTLKNKTTLTFATKRSDMVALYCEKKRPFMLLAAVEIESLAKHYVEGIAANLDRYF